VLGIRRSVADCQAFIHIMTEIRWLIVVIVIVLVVASLAVDKSNLAYVGRLPTLEMTFVMRRQPIKK
jgi:hypothetical protein